MRSIKDIRSSIQRREDDMRIRIGSQHVSQNRWITTEVENLWDVEVKVFSQWGEDGIIDFLCHKLQISKPRILEFGAGCFSECNSRFAAHNRNASVYAVDARKDLPEGLMNSGLMWRNSLFCEVIKVTRENVCEIFQRAAESIGGVDILSMDLDGNDYWLLERILLDQVKVVVAEYNPIFGHKNKISVEYSNQSRFERHYSGLLFGASLNAFIEMLSKKSFVFLGSNRVGNNAFFVRKDLIKKVGVRRPNLSNLERFVDWRCRESRNQERVLTFLNAHNMVKLLKEQEVIEVKSNKRISIEEALRDN